MCALGIVGAIIATTKNIFNRDRFTSVVQASNHQQQWQQHESHRNFWNLLTKVGGVAIRKFGLFPQFGGFRSICLQGINKLSGFKSILCLFPKSTLPSCSCLLLELQDPVSVNIHSITCCPDSTNSGFLILLLKVFI